MVTQTTGAIATTIENGVKADPVAGRIIARSSTALSGVIEFGAQRLEGASVPDAAAAATIKTGIDSGVAVAGQSAGSYFGTPGRVFFGIALPALTDYFGITGAATEASMRMLAGPEPECDKCVDPE
jgi:hypothetical protein